VGGGWTGGRGVVVVVEVAKDDSSGNMATVVVLSIEEIASPPDGPDNEQPFGDIVTPPEFATSEPAMAMDVVLHFGEEAEEDTRPPPFGAKSVGMA